MRTFAVLALLAAAAPATAAPRIKVAITEIRSVQGVAAGTATILSDIIVSEVARHGYDVISQSDITAMVGFERQKKVLGCSDDSSCLAEIGGALGVDYMLAGQVGQIGSRFRISLLLVDSRKAKVAARSAQFCEQNEDELARAAEATVGQLLAAARGEVPLPPPPVARAPPVSAPSLAAKPPDVPAPGPAGTPGKAAGSPKPFRMSRIPAYVTTGAGGVVFLGGALAGLAARAQYDDLSARQGTFGYYDDYLAERDGIKKLGIAANAMMLTGAVATGVGGWLFWRASRPPVAVVPAIGSDHVGLVATASF
jgi:TolB-like protein